ncbi:DMT family transporter [Streptomyces sp. NRRL WC-3626]|uniref:DMT family transporter n=1 Tax=Streptomyces sp. NRRL WC-3626 TaxID=1463926 RepID=UPI000996AE01|nr:DMT family transporter [Streptomyces sp. NRRL WC-3626]
MSAVLVAVLLSLVSAVAYAAAAVAQERLASRSGGTLRVLGDGAWWWAVALNASAALLHVVALGYGPLTVVQPLGALTLVAAVPMGARLAGRRVRAVEWRGTALTLAGLAAVLVTASGPAPDHALSAREALVVAGGTAALIGLLSWPGTRPGLRHATASGIASGVASALTQTVMVGSGPLPEVVVVAVLVAAFAVSGLLLSQTAYRDGLGAPLAVVTLTNPLAAAVLGATLLGERLNGGPAGVLLAAAGAAVAARGVLLLTRTTGAPGARARAVVSRRRTGVRPPPNSPAPAGNRPATPTPPSPPVPAGNRAAGAGGWGGQAGDRAGSLVLGRPVSTWPAKRRR